MKDISDRDLRELRRIQESIPKEWKDTLITKELVTPHMARGIEKMLRDKHLTAEQKEKLQAVRDSGYFHQTEEAVNKRVQKKIDKYLNEEINKSIKAGRLSKHANKGLHKGV